MLAPISGVGGRMAAIFGAIGAATALASRANVPVARGILSRLLAATGAVQVGQMLGIDLWPFNNSSDREQVIDIVTEAMESGMIQDNRGIDRRTGVQERLRAVIIEYDRTGETVEQMYMVSYHPGNPRSAVRRASRSSNVIRRRRTPQRRSR